MGYHGPKSGFTLLELILVVVFILLVGVAIYTAVGHKKPTVAINQTPSPSKTPIASASPSSTPAPNELDVSQLGFKMTLPDDLTDLIYSLKLNQSGSDVNGTPYTFSYVTFSTQSLTNADANCNAAAGPLGTFEEYDFDPIGKAGNASAATTRQVGSYYLVHETPQQPCSANQSVDNTQTSLLPLVVQAFNSASPLQ